MYYVGMFSIYKKPKFLCLSTYVSLTNVDVYMVHTYVLVYTSV